jgi:hypothetical protein
MMRIREVLERLQGEEQFAPWFCWDGPPIQAPWRLAVVSLMQRMERLTKKQAAEAVRSRIDWKYTLGLELTHPGTTVGVLTMFQRRLWRVEKDGRLFAVLQAAVLEQEQLHTGSEASKILSGEQRDAWREEDEGVAPDGPVSVAHQAGTGESLPASPPFVDPALELKWGLALLGEQANKEYLHWLKRRRQQREKEWQTSSLES